MLDQWRIWRVAPRAGFEPATIRLTVECSTAELPRNRRTKVRERAAYNKAFRACKGPNHRLRCCVKPSWKVPALQRFVVVFEPGHAVAGTRTMPFRHTQM